jgi:hypothetical protein
MDIQGFSERVIELAERMSDVADAAAGKQRKSPSAFTRLVVLPATGAGVYALVKSDFLGQHAKVAVKEAKTRGADLSDDLVNSVRQASQSPPKSSSASSASSRGGARRPTNRSGGQQRKRPTSASKRKTGS